MNTYKVVYRFLYIVFLAIVVLVITGDYACPFLLIFKIPCPGCGMTRACKALLRLDLRAALSYNFLFPIPILWAAYQILPRRLRFKRKTEAFLVAISMLLFFIRWFSILFFI